MPKMFTVWEPPEAAQTFLDMQEQAKAEIARVTGLNNTATGTARDYASIQEDVQKLTLKWAKILGNFHASFSKPAISEIPTGLPDMKFEPRK